MSFCFCGKYAPYAYKKKTGDLTWFCFEHSPKAKKLQKEKKEIAEAINLKNGATILLKADEKPDKLLGNDTIISVQEKTGALYYDN